MPHFDPRHWNLLSSTLLFAVACNADEPADTMSADESDTGLPYECYSDGECPPDEACISLFCRPYSIPDECELPPLAEIPLPALPDVVEAAFADIGGDADDELLLLLDDGVAVLRDDDSVLTTAWPMPLPPAPQAMVPLALDGDAAIDLVAFSLPAGVALVALGDGAGGFMVVGSLVDLPQLSSPVAIDLDLDGLDEVVALDVDAGQALLFDDLLALSSLSVVLDDTGLETTTGLGVLDADADTAPDLLLDGLCQAKLLYGPDLSAADLLSDPTSPQGDCEWRAVAFADGEPEQPFALMNTGWLQRWHLPDATYQYLAQPETYSTVAVIGPTPSASASLLLGKPGETAMIWDWADDGSACHALLPVSGSRFEVGRRSAGTRNFVIYGGGDLRLWSLDP